MVTYMGIFQEGIQHNDNENILVRGHGASRKNVIQASKVKVIREGEDTMAKQFDLKKPGAIVLFVIGIAVLLSLATQQKVFSTIGGMIIFVFSLSAGLVLWKDSKADEGKV